jgi:hypothetical protein
MGVLFTAVSGWVLVVLLATTIGLAYWLRRAPPVSSDSERVPLLDRLRPHFWLGFGIAPITFAHLWPAMSEGWVRRVDQPGLYLAAGAFVLTIGQVVLGLRLRDVRSRSRRAVRRVHFWTMALIAALTIGHVAINSATVRVLFG